MIPYQELATALAQWRARSGLPSHSTGPAPAPRPIVPAPIVPAPIAQVASAPIAAPRTAPPAPPPGRTAAFTAPTPPPVAARPPTNLDEELDADVLDEDAVYDNEGNDFAMSFGGPPAAASGSIGGDDEIEDSTSIAQVTSPAPALDDPFETHTAAVDRADVWPEVAEAQNWQADQTNATAYGWGQGVRPTGQAARPGTDPDDDGDGSTVVGSTKPR